MKNEKMKNVGSLSVFQRNRKTGDTINHYAVMCTKACHFETLYPKSTYVIAYFKLLYRVRRGEAREGREGK
jgi:hypothetical protein